MSISNQSVVNQNYIENEALVSIINEGPMLETLDYTIRIGRTPTFLYFDLVSIVDFRVQSAHSAISWERSIHDNY